MKHFLLDCNYCKKLSLNSKGECKRVMHNIGRKNCLCAKYSLQWCYNCNACMHVLPECNIKFEKRYLEQVCNECNTSCIIHKMTRQTHSECEKCGENREKYGKGFQCRKCNHIQTTHS